MELQEIIIIIIILLLLLLLKNLPTSPNARNLKNVLNSEYTVKTRFHKSSSKKKKQALNFIQPDYKHCTISDSLTFNAHTAI